MKNVQTTKKFNRLLTEFGENFNVENWSVYPRPMLKRDSFFCLNGEWDFAVCENFKNDFLDKTALETVGFFKDKIIVPFAPESILSGIEKVFSEKFARIYRKTFVLPKDFIKDRVLLHFGAVDQVAKVYLNGTLVGEHVGGYIPFTIDITKTLQPDNTLIVEVYDNLSNLVLPYGKQSVKRGGMWYTPVSGIWQSVWLESVSEKYVKDLYAYYENGKVHFEITGVKNATIKIQTPNGEIECSTQTGKACVEITEPNFWSPENPYLYNYTVETECDLVCSYFAIRTLTIKNVNGKSRLCLNGKPYFFHALLDQGYWSDGIFTPASPKAFTEELQRVKALGFNTLRKHIKIEPQIFYAECDRLGIIVWQDMINNGDYSFIRDTALPTIGFISRKDKNLHKDNPTRQAFLQTMEQTVKTLKKHPSVCYWTIFNEGWGQFESQKAYEMLKRLDNTRFIDTTSGWFRCGESSVDSYHVYFKKLNVNPKQRDTDKPIVVSEFGGYVYYIKENSFNPYKIYGYGKCKTREAFVERLRSLYLEQVLPSIKNGLCATVYTQVSDVEDETNGLFTYDRKKAKILPEEFIDISQKLQSAITE